MNAWDKFLKVINKNNLIKANDKILLAVSGGPDSICLTHLFWRLRKTCPINLAIVYFDHGLRKQAVKEIKFIKNVGKKLDIPVTIERISVNKYANLKKMSTETAGRTLRYNSLIKLAKKLKFSKIATGHNANDNAETILMWLTRGTGTNGLAGIPLLRCAEKKLKIIRPILSVTRKEIVKYLQSQRLSYCIDHSNFSLEYTRNKIRHQVVPIFEKYNPCFVEHLFNLSQIIACENEYLSLLTSKIVKKSTVITKNKITLDLKRFFGYNSMIKSRIIKSILPEKRSVAQVERLLGWIMSSHSGKNNFSRNWQMEKKPNKLIFKKIV